QARGEPPGDSWSDWFPAERRINRFFYHSFPRRSRQDPAHNPRGLDILRSMAAHGLLLTPEVHTIRDQVAPGRVVEVQVVQQRICFTDLSPNEVPWHAAEFGGFALEFDFEDLRNLAAFPMIYYPNRPADMEGASWFGNSLIARIGLMSNMALPRLA